mmetsp:Transcript_35342/g.90843  ORF Transcript_35342/g.90843 Transcript_35342/m.90843 type:complete len:228 (+) Transcript_35342:869-1552(+)
MHGEGALGDQVLHVLAAVRLLVRVLVPPRLARVLRDELVRNQLHAVLRCLQRLHLRLHRLVICLLLQLGHGLRTEVLGGRHHGGRLALADHIIRAVEEVGGDGSGAGLELCLGIDTACLDRGQMVLHSLNLGVVELHQTRRRSGRRATRTTAEDQGACNTRHRNNRHHHRHSHSALRHPDLFDDLFVHHGLLLLRNQLGRTVSSHGSELARLPTTQQTTGWQGLSNM